jgi:pimeloyl-ACP methyl ester carboxylesterase
MRPSYLTGSMQQATLILIHGATGNGRMWDPVRRGIDPKYRVLTPDLPGHGSRRDEHFTLQGAVDTVVAAAQSVPDSPVVVGGDSLGGYTSLASAEFLPASQLRGLVLGGCSSNLSGTTLFPYLWRSAMFRFLIAVRGEDSLIRAATPRLASEFKLQPQDVDAMVDAGLSIKVFPQAVDALRNIDFRSKLAAVKQPVLILNGDKDRGHIRQEPSFVAVGQHVTTHRFVNCGHGVTVLRAAECATLINAFSAQVFAP